MEFNLSARSGIPHFGVTRLSARISTSGTFGHERGNSGMWLLEWRGLTRDERYDSIGSDPAMEASGEREVDLWVSETSI